MEVNITLRMLVDPQKSVHTLPETISSSLKMDGWKMILSFWVSSYFQGANRQREWLMTKKTWFKPTHSNKIKPQVNLDPSIIPRYTPLLKIKKHMFRTPPALSTTRMMMFSAHLTDGRRVKNPQIGTS